MTVSEFNEEYNGNMEVFKKMECKNLASKRLSAILPPRPSDDEYVSQPLNLLNIPIILYEINSFFDSESETYIYVEMNTMIPLPCLEL
jgi:hypothetical protein